VSIQSHFFVAEQEAALENDGGIGQRSELRAEWRRIFAEHLKPLSQLLIGTAEGFETIAKADDYSSFTTRLPDSLVHALAELPDATLARTAQQWAQSEDLWDPNEAELAELLQDLRRLAAAAARGGNGVFLWNSE
jgi:hypothetical protein